MSLRGARYERRGNLGFLVVYEVSAKSEIAARLTALAMTGVFEMEAALIDYAAGNLHSVAKALGAAGFTVRHAEHPEEAEGAACLVLPGQGHFGQVMAAFRASGFEPLVREHIAAGYPFLGICVGLQLLLEGSEEAPGVPGLGLLPGTVRRFHGDVSVPQMGWNQLCASGPSVLLEGVPDGSFVYFANAYYAELVEPLPGALTRYGPVRFQSALERGTLCATQFHPEKSQGVGLRILRNFRTLAAQA